MLAKAKKIIGAKAITQNGQHLGRVADFEVNTTYHRINKYHIQTDILGFLKQPLIINTSQVIAFKNNQLIVKDGALPDEIKKQTTPDIEYVK